MGFGDDYNSIAATLARLVSSPSMRILGNKFKANLPQMSGPFGLNTPNSSSYNNNSIGASPRLGQILNGIGDKFNGPGVGLGALVSQLGQKPQDPMQDLYQQLLDQLQSPVQAPTGIDKEDLMRQVQAALNPIYDQRENRLKTNTKNANTDISGMYKALSQDYEKLAPQQVAQAKDAQEQVKQLYGTLRSNIEGSYSRVSDEQGDLFKQLGIESALPDVLADQQAPVQDALTAASKNQAAEQQRYLDQGQIDSTYYREGAPQAIMRGNEINTDLLSQLQGALDQTEAERTSGIQSGYMDQLGQAQNSLNQQQQAATSETGRRQEMLWQMLQSQLSGGNQQQQAATPDTFMSQLPPNIQQAVGGAFTSLQRSPEAIYGKVADPRNPVPGTFVETTPNWYMAQADKMLQDGQIDETTYQALQMYMQLYFKTGQ